MLTPRLDAAAGASPELRSRSPNRVRHRIHADTGTSARMIKVANDTSRPMPRTTQAMAATRNKGGAWNHTAVVGVRAGGPGGAGVQEAGDGGGDGLDDRVCQAQGDGCHHPEARRLLGEAGSVRGEGVDVLRRLVSQRLAYQPDAGAHGQGRDDGDLGHQEAIRGKGVVQAAEEQVGRHQMLDQVGAPGTLIAAFLQG